MDLTLTSSQESLRNDARALLIRHCPPERVRALETDEKGFCSTLWGEMGRRGWLALGTDTNLGGPGLLDRALLFEEIGRASTPGPFLAHYEALGALEALGARSFIEGLESGSPRASLALIEEPGSLAPSSLSMQIDGDTRLSGSKLFVPWVRGAESLLVVARDEASRPGLFRVDTSHPNLRVQPMPNLGSERLFEVLFDALPAERVSSVKDSPVEDLLDHALAHATILACAELAGAAAAALDYAVEYVGRREQFGRAIGSFQAVQHHCANMAMDAEAAHLAAMDAAARVDAGEEPRLFASSAKVTCSEAARRVTTTGHQILGGVGFLEDADMHLWTRRVKALESRLGTPDWHRERIADDLALPR
ncbi:MAG: acyl-CoA/acyl-ACP dehydrogenase [Deltaproteobacteria bacterium]|jgi:alkylation response protein AidB-like acyl-CoA dehydrogenase|nr:acyl-CoA/acyl-ACP dehydrogenase [Deltaproteobacteria bacterium]